MRFRPERYDAILMRLVLGGSRGDEEVAGNPNMLVPWYLMASYRYYAKDDPFLTDGGYDWLCAELDAKWDEVEHRHKSLIDRAALKAGTGYDIEWDKLPSIITSAADHLVEKYENLDEIKPKRPVVEMMPTPNIDDLLGAMKQIDTAIERAVGIGDLL